MKTFRLHTGADMPAAGFGTFLLNGSVCTRAVLTALESGCRLIDTAEAYGNEAAVGTALRESGIPREDLFLVTKVNFRSYEHTRETVENSLRRLQTDYLDLVLLHWPFGNYYAAWRELESLVQEGVIRAAGVSNFDPDRLIDLIHFNTLRPAVNQIETHLYCQRREEHTWEDKYGIAHMAYAPLGQGQAAAMLTEPRVTEIAERYGKTPAQILLRRTIEDGAAVIPKSSQPQHIRDNLALFDFSLTAADIASLRALDKTTPFIGKAEDPRWVETAITW